jgi:8-oxo-dGTP diphosphatase
VSDAKPFQYVQERRVASAILYNDRGEFLLQQRDDKPGLPYPNTWNPFGGQLEPGEDPLTGILRELEEELELTDVTLVQWTEFRCPVRSTPEMDVIHFSFHGRIDDDLSRLALHEGQAMAFFAPALFDSLAWSFNHGDVLRDFVETVYTQR